MSGNVTPYVDFLTSTDSGENNASSIQPITNGEQMTQTVLQRPDENIRKRLEVLRSLGIDSLFLQNADRKLIIAGPGKVTWPGSTTAGQNGIPTLSDNLWILPMLTPGFAQVAPVPPVASKFGVIHLKRVTGSLDSILVTSARRSYAAGDQINITVTAGVAFSCTLDTEDTGAYRRTIKIVAVTGVTTLATVITALNGLIPPAPDNTQLVTAALENGAANGDIFLSTQARQFMSGNYDGEGHTITPANLASFFASNPGSVLAEGDTLCAQFAMLNDTASTGGRRQALPENSNTSITAGMFFNSRVSPEKLVNALPICKVVNGSLVFATGAEIPAGSTNISLAQADVGSRIIRNGGFEHGVTSNTGRFGITDWENRNDLAVNGTFRLSTTSPATGGKHLEFNQTNVGAATGRIEQSQEIPVTPGQVIRVSASVQQLIAPTAGAYSVVLYWGDANSAASSSSSVALQVLSTTDGAYRLVQTTVAVPAGKRFLKTVTVEVVGVTLGSTGVSLRVDDLQVTIEPVDGATASVNNVKMAPRTLDALLLEDPTTYQVGQLATLLRFDKSTPASEGSAIGERKDQDYTGGNLPPALAWYGRLLQLGLKLLATPADARKARISAPNTDLTLLFESIPTAATTSALRIYYSGTAKEFQVTVNASFDGTNWNKDQTGAPATLLTVAGYVATGSQFNLYTRRAGDNAAWSTWNRMLEIQHADTPTIANPVYSPLQSFFDSANNRRVVRDHLGFDNSRVETTVLDWVTHTLTPTATGTAVVNVSYDVFKKGPGVSMLVAANNDSIFFESGYLFGTTVDGDHVSILEWEIDTSGNLTGTPGLTVEAGYKHDQSLPSTEDYVKFSKTSASANWQFMTRSTALTFSQDTGVTATGVQRFRIEWYGANHPGGARALGYIDGVLVGECADATKLPDADPMPMSMIYKSTGATIKSIAVSPFVHRRRRWLADDAV